MKRWQVTELFQIALKEYPMLKDININIKESNEFSCICEGLETYNITYTNMINEKDKFYNIIIKYLHEVDFSVNDLKILDSIPYENCPKLYYAIPCIIYCLDSYIRQLSNTKNEVGKHSSKI